MSIPERFYRIAKHKFSEIRDRVDRWDDEAQEAEATSARKADSKGDARRELKDAMSAPTAVRPDGGAKPLSGVPLRTPDEIRRGVSPTVGSAMSNQPDPLTFHYRLLGVEPGMEFADVQAAYDKLSARCDPARFPLHSTEAQEAERIRKRLEDSYKVLRDALDSTARRFDLLEFDAPDAKPAPTA